MRGCLEAWGNGTCPRTGEDFHTRAPRAFGRRRVGNGAGELAEDQRVRDFECPGIAPVL